MLTCRQGFHSHIYPLARQVGAIGPGLDALLAPTMLELLTELKKAEGPIAIGPILGHVVWRITKMTSNETTTYIFLRWAT